MPNPTLGTTTPNATLDPEAIDALMPRPWSPAQRLMVGLVAVALVVGAVLIVRSGLLGPQLEHVPAWGSNVEAMPDGSLVAERVVPIRNEGMLPIDLQEAALPSIDGLTWLDIAGIPTTLAPGEQLELTVRFEVRNCALDVAGLDALPLLARSGIAPARLVDVRAPSSEEPESRASGVGGGTSEELLAAWAEQPPSWVLDAIAPLCLDPDGAHTVSVAGADR